LGEVRLLRRVLGHLHHRLDGSHALVPVFFTRFLPGALINVATIVHSDEALLAAGFISRCTSSTPTAPREVPDGHRRLHRSHAVAELKRDKPAEYEALASAGKLEENW